MNGLIVHLNYIQIIIVRFSVRSIINLSCRFRQNRSYIFLPELFINYCKRYIRTSIVVYQFIKEMATNTSDGVSSTLGNYVTDSTT